MIYFKYLNEKAKNIGLPETCPYMNKSCLNMPGLAFTCPKCGHQFAFLFYDSLEILKVKTTYFIKKHLQKINILGTYDVIITSYYCQHFIKL